jgi:putrescine aminotransferase
MNSQVTNPKTLEWQALGRDHHLPPFTDYKALNAKGARIITKAEGVYIWDSEGNKILDGMAGLWCVNVGYGREELVQAATRQMRELPFYNLFFQTAHPPAVELSKAIAEIAPEGMNHVFSPAPVRKPTTPCCAWFATTGRSRASRRRKSSSAAGTATTARPSPVSAWAA